MSKATITDNLGDGRYLVGIEFEKDRYDAEKTRLDEQIATANTRANEAAIALFAAEAQASVQKNNLDAAIIAYNIELIKVRKWRLFYPTTQKHTHLWKAVNQTHLLRLRSLTAQRAFFGWTKPVGA